MNAINSEAAPQDSEGGPMWGRFFESFGGQEDSESVVSGSHLPHDMTSPPPFASSPLGAAKDSEVYPGDSASLYEEDSEHPGGRSLGAALSSISKEPAPPPPVDDGTYVFKFSSPSGRTHRFEARKDDYEHVREIVAGKLTTDPFFTNTNAPAGSTPLDPLDFHILYTDKDGDVVVITSDGDVSDAVNVARAANSDRVVLTLQGGKGWGLEAKKAAEEAAVLATREKERADALVEAEKAKTPKAVHFQNDDIMGIPRDLLLPASLGVLAVAIIAVFTIHRLSD